MSYGERIRFYREQRGMYQVDLGEALGVSSQAVSKWELNKAEPDSETIRKLCKIFNISADELLGIEASPSKKQAADEDIKFALFGGSNDITDAQFEEVKQFARFIREREGRDK